MATSWEVYKKKREQGEEDIAPVKKSSKVTLDVSEDDDSSWRSYSASRAADKLVTNSNPLSTVVKQQQESKERKWFESGAFSDGYQFGDLTKTILGTGVDVYEDVAKGILGIGEGVIDTGAYLLGGGAKLIGQEEFAQKTEDFIKKDLVEDLGIARRIANTGNPIGWANSIVNGTVKDNFNFTDLSKTGISKLASSQANDKFEANSVLGDKSDSLVESGGQLLGTVGLQSVGVPWWATTGITSFGSGTEEAFKNDATYGEAGVYGLVSAGAEILTEKISGGISFGGKTLDAGLKEVLTKNISNKTLQTLGKFGLDATGEGMEEVFSQVIQNVGQKLTYADEKTWQEILASEEAMDAYLESFIGGAVLGGGSSVVNTVSERSNTDIAPVDNTAQIQGLQEAIAAKQQELTQVQDVREQQIIQEEIEVLNQELNEVTNAQQFTSEDLKQQQFTYEMAENDSEYKQAVYESASKYMNDTKEAHDFVDTVAKIAEDRQTRYEFVNTEAIKEAGYDIENVSVNGLVTEDGRILVNIDSNQGLDFIVGHETTHLLEGTQEYQALQDLVVEYAKSKGIYEDRAAKLHSLYKDTNADIDAELTSDLVGELLFTDQAFIENLSVKQPTLFEKIKNFISDLVVKFKGTEQEKQLRKIQRSFEKAYKTQGTQTNTDTKYSVSENNAELSDEAKKQLHRYINMDTNQLNKAFSEAVDNKENMLMEYNTLQKEYKELQNTEDFKSALNDFVNSETPTQKTTDLMNRANKYAEKLRYYNEQYEKYKAQQDAINSLLMGAETDTRSVEQIVKEAEKHFGITKDFKETAYIDVNGKQLDFSGKKDGGQQGRRSLDHRQINEINIDMDSFIQMGNIRVKPEGNGFEVYKMPNDKQLSKLQSYVEQLKGDFYVDVINDNGTYDYGTYKSGTPFSKVVSDLQYYFKNGQFPKQSEFAQFRYSLTAQEEAPVGNVFGADLKLQVEEAIAPLQETIENLTEQVQALQKSVAPVTQQEDLDLAPTSQEIVEQQGQEAFDNITDNEAPIAPENTTPEPIETIDTNKIESPFDIRDIDAVGKRNVKAYQYENPEVRPYFQAEAQNMIYDLDNTVKGQKGMIQDELGNTEFYGTTRQTAEAIAYLKDNYGYSYAQIRKGLNDIIEDNGKENNAVAKRIEFMLDERLREGYTTSDGIPIPPNEEYINFLKDKQITEYNREAFNALTDTDIPIENEIAPIEEPTQEQTIAPDVQESTTGQLELKVEESIAPTENEAQNRNTELSDTSVETQEQEKVAQILSERPTQENKKQRLWAKVRAAIFDKGSVFEDLSIKTKNREIMAKWDNTLLAEAVAQDVMLNGTREIDAQSKSNKQVSKSLVDIKAEVENSGKVQEFSEYLYHKHNINRMSLEANAQARMAELLDTTLRKYEVEDIEKLSRKRLKKEDTQQGNLFAQEEGDISKEQLIEAAKEYVRLSEVKNKPVFGDSVTADVSQEIVNEYEMNNPEFMDWAKDVYDYNNANLSHLINNGVISQETADQFAEMYPNYVPIGRAEHLGNAINVPLDTNRTSVNAPIKRAKGGNGDILPLFDTMARRTIQTYRAAAKNDFGVELKNTLKGRTSNQITNIDEILDNVDQQEDLLQEGKNGQAPTFTVFENGEKVTYEITQDMYDALKPVSESSILSTTFKPFNKISNFHRGVLTEYNPVFMLTNSIKDAQDILLNSQHATKTYSKLPESYAQILSKGYWYQEYMANGGQQNSYFDSQEGNFDTEAKGIGKVLELPPLKQISQLNNVIELAPRLAEYIASRESGRSKKVAMLDAARVTTNFKAGGDVTKWANRNGATFLNASIQGAMQQVRNVREANMNGLKGYANLASKFALAGLPAMILNSLLWGDDEEYEELSDYVKQSYWIVGKYGDGNFIRIPKGRMITVVQEALNQMTNLVTGNDEADLGQFLEIVGNNIAPNNPIENNVLAPIIQAATNKTWHGGDLVPTRLQDVPAEEQYDESIDKLSIAIGQATGISPYKINYVLDQYSGGIGDVFLPMMTEQAEGGNDSLGSKLLAPLTSKFSVDSTMKNQNVSDLYTLSEELTTKANSSKATDTDVLQNKYLNAIKSEMNELYKEKRGIQNSKLPDSEKYNQVREIQKQINDMAKEAINNYEDVTATSNYASIGDKEYYNKNGTWTKVNEEEATELNSMNMTTEQKDTYFNLKTKISTIENSETENKKSEIAKAVMNTNLSDEQKAYIYVKNYSSDETLNMVVNGGINFNEYLKYAAQTITADKDSNGKTISGSKKAKVISAINSLNLDIPQKAMLIRKEYSSFRDYNNDIVRYVNRLDIDYQTKVDILSELEMTVSADGTVSWK